MLLEECDNAVLFHYNSNNLSKDYIESFENKQKQFEVSFLSGAKKLVEGHKLRQEIYEIGDQINIPKKWFYVLDDFDQKDFDNGGIGRPNDQFWVGKQICFKESMYHVAVENVKYNNFYTEKISDAFSTKTIPIYWGCPNINEFFDTSYWVKTEDLFSFKFTEDYYYENLNKIEDNFARAKIYCENIIERILKVTL